MKFKRIYQKLKKLGFSEKDIQVLFLNNENLKKSYFFKKGLREISITKILEKGIKILQETPISKIQSENEEPETMEIEISLRHDYSGTINVYGTSYERHTIEVSREFYENATSREIREYINESLDMDSNESPSDYEISDREVNWEDDYQTEIDDWEEV
jgi:hypothetical protein